MPCFQLSDRGSGLMLLRQARSLGITHLPLDERYALCLQHPRECGVRHAKLLGERTGALAGLRTLDELRDLLCSEPLRQFLWSS